MTMLKITYTKSAIGYKTDQKQTIVALGLKRLHHTVEKEDTPVLRGMIRKVAHLVSVNGVPADTSGSAQPLAFEKGGSR